MNKDDGPARLNRANPCDSYFKQDLIIRISFTTLVALAFIIFFIICLMIVPPTHGFYWW